jgi:predicted AAA+ superfamily ATPase
MRRSQTEIILNDLKRKMVFLVGPRQSGKTWLAREISKSYSNPAYLTYDHYEDRKIIHRESWLPKTDLLVLDELHKMKGWKNFLKGVFDTKPEHLHILVTGSARLDAFRQTGDSLAGRFLVHHLLPFSPRELDEIGEPADLDRLIRRGGFPEPYLAETDIDADRWRQLYADSLIRTDVLDFERIHDMRNMQLVFDMLRHRVGSPVSMKSIAEDVQAAPNTVKKYIRILEALYIVFQVLPHSRNIARAILKEPKIYFFDTGLVSGDEGAKFENLVAVSLLKHAYRATDETGAPASVHYLRTKDGREVDFCFVEGERIKAMIEVKTDDSQASRHLKYFHSKYGLKGFQIVRYPRRERMEDEIEIRAAEGFLRRLALETGIEDYPRSIGGNEK